MGFTPEWYWPLVHEKFRDSFLQKAQKTAEKKARQEAERQALRDKNIKIKQQHMERIQREKAEKERQKLKDADADADANEREVVEKSMAELNVE